jgi:2-polyprenyl-6-methoxyphenol hydroxylase-like FAD-dependent oxidoreductase
MNVTVVGARCADASTAMLLARAGVRVLLIDQHELGRDVISTHAIMRTGVMQLARWGLLPEIRAAATPAITKTTFHYGKDTHPIDIRSEHSVDFLCAPRRTVLDKILVNAARKAGAEVHHGVSLQKLKTSLDGRVVGVHLKDRFGIKSEITADLVVGADGRLSLVVDSVKAQIYMRGQNSSGCVYGYFSDIEVDGFHGYFGDKVTAGVIPTNNNQHCVFAAVPGQRFADIYREDMAGGFMKTAMPIPPNCIRYLKKLSLEEGCTVLSGSPVT